MSKVRKVSLAKLDEFFSAIAHSERLYLPVDTAAGAEYKEWAEGTKWSDALNTVRSAKDFFFPQTENLMDFKMQDKKIELIDTRRETEDFVVFGVRACDARAFRVLDNVFLAEPVDTYYQNRRKHGTIVTVACTRPVETCFCGTFDIDPANADGDVNAYKTEDALYLEAKTEKGEKLLAALTAVTEEADEKPAGSAEGHSSRSACAKLPLANLRPDAFGQGQDQRVLQRSRVEGAVRVLSGLRHLHLRLPHLPVLRHPGFQHRPRRQALPLLGQLHVLRLYQNVRRSAPPDPDGAVPPALHAQAGVLPHQQRRPVLLRRLRPLHRTVPHSA